MERLFYGDARPLITTLDEAHANGWDGLTCDPRTMNEIIRAALAIVAAANHPQTLAELIQWAEARSYDPFGPFTSTYELPSPLTLATGFGNSECVRILDKTYRTARLVQTRGREAENKHTTEVLYAVLSRYGRHPTSYKILESTIGRAGKETVLVPVHAAVREPSALAALASKSVVLQTSEMKLSCLAVLLACRDARHDQSIFAAHDDADDGTLSDFVGSLSELLSMGLAGNELRATVEQCRWTKAEEGSAQRQYFRALEAVRLDRLEDLLYSKGSSITAVFRDDEIALLAGADHESALVRLKTRQLVLSEPAPTPATTGHDIKWYREWCDPVIEAIMNDHEIEVRFRTLFVDIFYGRTISFARTSLHSTLEAAESTAKTGLGLDPASQAPEPMMSHVHRLTSAAIATAAAGGRLFHLQDVLVWARARGYDRHTHFWHRNQQASVSNYLTPLTLAIGFGNLHCVRLLLSYEADIAGTEDGRNALMVALQTIDDYSASAEIASILLDQLARARRPTELSMWQALPHAAGSTKALDLLISRGITLRDQSPDFRAECITILWQPFHDPQSGFEGAFGKHPTSIASHRPSVADLRSRLERLFSMGLTGAELNKGTPRAASGKLRDCAPDDRQMLDGLLTRYGTSLKQIEGITLKRGPKGLLGR